MTCHPRHSRRTRYLHPVALAAMVALEAPAAWAQRADDSVVNITSQRRVEPLQGAPLAITAISAREMDTLQIRRLDDLRAVVPNIIIEPATGTSSAAKVFMRGVGTDESLFTADPSVAIYIDDQYIARMTGALFDMFDLQRVEVLRGPQGTLYGRNATGGAIRYITRVPNGEKRFGAEGRIGNLGRVDALLTGGGSVGEGTALSFGLMAKQRDGYLTDITNNRAVNDERVEGARAAAAITLSKSTSLRVSLDVLRQRSGAHYATGVLDPARAAQFNRPVNNADGNLLTVETNLAGGINNLDQSGGSLSFSTDMGAFEWRNIVTRRKLSNELFIDLDGTAATRFHLYQNQSQNQTSYESQLVSTGSGPLSWTAGVFWFNEKNTQPTRQDIFAVGGVNTVRQDTTATALYGQADYSITKIWKATAGLRGSSETKEFGIDAVRANGTPNFNFSNKKTWTRTDWKLGLSGQFDPNLLGYASATTGFKSGGYNGRASSAAQAALTLKPETVLTYELGFKSTLLGGAATFNANVFRNDYSDLQLTAFDPNGVSNLFNAASATIQGLEIESAVQITRDWQVSLNLGTLDAEYKDYSAANAATFAGKQLKQAPKIQYGLGTTYRLGLAGGIVLASAQLKHVGDHYQNLANSEVIKTQAYNIVDARLAFEPEGGMFSLALWGKNLGNKIYYAGGFDIAGIGIASAYLNVPRTYGVDFKLRFW